MFPGRSWLNSRAAVWKAINALREEGCRIDSVPNRGYCLRRAETQLCATQVQLLAGNCSWAQQISVVDEVDSTNNLAKRQAGAGAPHGSIYITLRQTGGRGRSGRSFASPPGGVYLSALLRPKTEASDLLYLTAAVAVATRRAILDCCKIDVGIKWTNDLVVGRKKICGILTELSVEADSGCLEYAVLGIGINCNTSLTQFPEPVREVATSLYEASGHTVDPNALAAALVRRLWELDAQLPTQLEAWLAEYASACVTIGQDVMILRGGETRYAHAEGIDASGGLLVRYDNGETAVVNSGEVSVRGMYGYV